MKLCRHVLCLAFVGGVFVVPAQASLIANGDFESVTAGKFDSWTYSASGAAAVESQSVISGKYSAEIARSDTLSYLQQYPSASISDFVFECDFAVFPITVPTKDRSMNIQFFYGNGFINLRVGPNNYLQAYDGSTWRTLNSVLGPLTAQTTTDTGTLLVWDGETPVKNHLMVLGHLASTGSTYDVILNGVPSMGISYFQNGSPNAQYHTLSHIWLVGQPPTDANWLVDNVALMRIPEPSTALLLATGGVLGMMGLVARRKGRGIFSLIRSSSPSQDKVEHDVKVL